MAFFNWFSGRSRTRGGVAGKVLPDHESSGLNRDDHTRPVAGGREKMSEPPPLKNAISTTERSSVQKAHRHARRELLYTAVRDAMIRAGVLSASYKFKVLSLDPRGDQFMVMMDLAPSFDGPMDRLADMEVLIAQGAKSRYNIRVTAVYWRMNELVSVGRAAAGARGSSRPAPLQPVIPAQAAGHPARPSMAAQGPVSTAYEPIQADEVAAFKQALAAASAQGPAEAPVRPTQRDVARSYTLLTGFEETEMPESPTAVPALSATQYGDLH